MRVLHVVHQYPPEHIGGAELYTRTVAQRGAAADMEVAVFARQSGAGTGEVVQEEAGVTVHRVWNGPMTPTQRYTANFRNGYLTRRFAALLASWQPDLVHIQHLMGLPLGLLAQLRRAQIPYLVTLHDYWWICANAQLVTNYDRSLCHGPRGHFNCTRCAAARADTGGMAVAPALWLSLRWRAHRLAQGLRDAQALAVAAPFVRDWYVQQGAPAEKFALLPLGVARPPQRKQRAAGAPVRFGYIGGLAWQKGVHVALDAFRQVQGDAEFWVAGDPTTDPEYAAHLQALAGGRVRFLGRLERAQVWYMLEQIDLLLAPSLWYETYCLSVHEAFAAGVPVLASRLGVLADTIQDDGNGRLAAPGDVAAWQAALQDVVDNPGQLARWRQAVTPPPTVEEHMQGLLALYRKCYFSCELN